MSEVYRFGISLDQALIDAFDKHIQKRNYANRSEAIRDLIREELVQKEWTEGGTVAGAITMIYDHHKRNLTDKMLDIQHDYQQIIICTQHVHLDHHHCMEIIAVSGKARDVQTFADLLKPLIGVTHLSLSITSTAQDEQPAKKASKKK